MSELVSVIMPSYNACNFLADSIESILAQTYQHWELLITDDGSTDKETVALLKAYCEKDERIKVEYLSENRGAGGARNHAIERAKGRYIAFCDSDDRWFPEKLERQIAFMQQKGCPLCHSSYIICDEKNEERGINIAPRKVTFGMELRDNKIGCLTAVYDVQLLGRKYFMPTLRKRQDWGLFLTIMRDCGVAYALSEPLALYRIRKQSVSRKKSSLIRYNIQVYHDVLGFSMLKSRLYFALVFMPTHTLKLLKRKYDSFLYMKRKENRSKN